MTTHASDSSEQRSAEHAIIMAVAQELEVVLAPARIAIGDAHVEIDGASPDYSVLVEAYARIGALKGAQPRKLATDAFKLAWAGQKLGAQRLILAVADEAAAGYLRRPGAWLTAAIADAGVEVLVAALDEDMRATVLAAQARQFR
ncbi:hypothetical protein [Microbacterium sp. CH1]|uniref:hypothetical protein n=1 Tax=Microbacterium sp. CH1 TaxID=1770208 RepID=UPI000787578B|nr:hypothetical protein [Microbacterium sp. CH1]KYJ97539.1 hypothetical protein AUV07_15040 [Microbacterium sp. CH1]